MKTISKKVAFQVIPDATVSTSVSSPGTPVELYGINIEGAGTGQVVTISSGASDVFQLYQVDSGAYRTDVFSRGVTFPGGCKIVGSEAARITVFYRIV